MAPVGLVRPKYFYVNIFFLVQYTQMNKKNTNVVGFWGGPWPISLFYSYLITHGYFCKSLTHILYYAGYHALFLYIVSVIL